MWLAWVGCGVLSPPVEDTACGRQPPLDWNNFGQGHLDTHCTGCHGSLLAVDDRRGAPIGVDLDSYGGALQWAERLEARSTGSNPTMPPGGGPSPDELVLFEEWLSCTLLPALHGADSGTSK
jgi:hypothetical protein